MPLAVERRSLLLCHCSYEEREAVANRTRNDAGGDGGGGGRVPAGAGSSAGRVRVLVLLCYVGPVGRQCALCCVYISCQFAVGRLPKC